MKKYDWLSNIKMCLFLLRFIGLFPKGDDTYNSGLYVIHGIFLFWVFFVCHIFVQAVNIYFIRTDLAAVTGTIYVLLLEATLVFKVYYLVEDMKMVKKLLKILDTDMFQPKNSVQINAIDTNFWYWNFIYKTFYFSSIGANLFMAIYPLADKKEPKEKSLPFLAWYPFNTTISPGFESTYIHQITSTCYISTAHINIDALGAALMVFTGSQFDILCDNLRNLHEHGQAIAVNFVKCVEHHKEILNFAHKSNEFLAWIFFVQFFVSAFTIGITMFQLTLVVPLSNEFFSLVSFGMAITVQTFMYCWFGNEIEIKSMKTLYAAFECEWTNFPMKTQRDLLFFTLKVQKPVKLSTLDLFYLSLDTFMKILKTSWSYFALLHQVNG